MSTGAFRREHIAFTFAVAYGIECHARAWVKQSSTPWGTQRPRTGKDLLDLIDEVLARMARSAPKSERCPVLLEIGPPKSERCPVLLEIGQRPVLLEIGAYSEFEPERV